MCARERPIVTSFSVLCLAMAKRRKTQLGFVYIEMYFRIISFASRGLCFIKCECVDSVLSSVTSLINVALNCTSAGICALWHVFVQSGMAVKRQSQIIAYIIKNIYK